MCIANRGCYYAKVNCVGDISEKNNKQLVVVVVVKIVPMYSQRENYSASDDNDSKSAITFIYEGQ